MYHGYAIPVSAEAHCSTRINSSVRQYGTSCMQIRVVINEIRSIFFSADFAQFQRSHHFALFYFETGCFVGFVVLELPQYYFQHARKLAQNLLDSDLICLRRHLLPPYLPSSPSIAIPSRLHHHSPLSRLASSTDRSRPLSSPPPLSSCRVVPRPCLSRLRGRSEETAASPHPSPSPSRRRRGKIPSIVVVLRSDDDASRRPPPPFSCAVQHLLS